MGFKSHLADGRKMFTFPKVLMKFSYSKIRRNKKQKQWLCETSSCHSKKPKCKKNPRTLKKQQITFPLFLIKELQKEKIKSENVVFSFLNLANECHFLLAGGYNAAQLAHKYTTTETGNDSNDSHKSIQIDTQGIDEEGQQPKTF